MNREEILLAKDITKAYQMGDELQLVLKNVNLSVQSGEFISILGPSGSGKTTLMNIIGCLDVPTSGKVLLSGIPIVDMEEKELARVRNREIGFIFQQFQLLPRLTALQNVELPLIYAGKSQKDRREIALNMLDRVGLSDKINNRPNQLSGGQQQRVAIARALSNNPTILLADEPTGSLDQKTGLAVMELFKELHKEGHTIIMITHNEDIAGNANRTVSILDGNLYEGGLPDVS